MVWLFSNGRKIVVWEYSQQSLSLPLFLFIFLTSYSRCILLKWRYVEKKCVSWGSRPFLHQIKIKPYYKDNTLPHRQLTPLAKESISLFHLPLVKTWANYCHWFCSPSGTKGKKKGTWSDHLVQDMGIYKLPCPCCPKFRFIQIILWLLYSQIR